MCVPVKILSHSSLRYMPLTVYLQVSALFLPAFLGLFGYFRTFLPTDTALCFANLAKEYLKFPIEKSALRRYPREFRINRKLTNQTLRFSTLLAETDQKSRHCCSWGWQGSAQEVNTGQYKQKVGGRVMWCGCLDLFVDVHVHLHVHVIPVV